MQTIYESEKYGTGDVKSHSALLKGELLDRITVKDKANFKMNSLKISIYANATVWELKKQVAKQLDLGPQHVRLLYGTANKEIKDIENGKTLSDLDFKNDEVVTA